MFLVPRSPNPVDLPNVLIDHLFGYLDDESLLRSACVSRGWRGSQAVRKKRGEAIERRYPPEIAQAFRESGLPIEQLAFLNLGNRMGTTDYVDFLWPSEIREPMRFRDRYGRYGLVFTVVAHPSIVRRSVWKEIWDRFSLTLWQGEVDRFPEIFREAIAALRGWNEVREGTVVLAQRYTGSPDRYVFWNSSPLPRVEGLDGLLNGRHLRRDHQGRAIEGCPRCPFNATTLRVETFLRPLLTGSDPDFSLKGYAPRKRVERGGLSKALLITSLAVVVLAYLIEASRSFTLSGSR